VDKPRVLLYADVNLNIIDGSSVWAPSVADALAGAGAEVTLLSKFPIRDHRILAPLLGRPEVRIVDPKSDGLIGDEDRLSAKGLVDAIRALDRSIEAAAIIVRGSAACDTLAGAQVGPGRLWCYLTDIPQAVTEAEPERVAQLRRIAAWSDKLLCQTEQLRGFVEGIAPEAVGKTALLPPIVPAEAFQPREASEGTGMLSLVYSGKLAHRWRTLEMCSLPGDLRKRGIEARLWMLGDKIHNDSGSEEYPDRMRRALTESYGVEWFGGVTRSEAIEKVRSADIALAWRDPSLDASLELSTKLLEFGACRVPVVLNRTPMHEDLLGRDYPLFVDDYESVLGAVARVASEPDTAKVAADRLAGAAARYSSEEAAARLAALLNENRLARGAVGWRGGGKRTVLIAGHDFKFIRQVAAFLDKHTDTRVTFDQWQGHNRHDAATSVERLREADVVLCEWMLGNAVWYSHNKRPGQRLVVRLHRVEVETAYPAKADLDAIDAVILVGQDMLERAQKAFDLPAHKAVVVPNAVDHPAYLRTKHRGHEFTLGLVGAVPRRKRLDLAIDLLRELRAHDPRFRLCVKSKAPWELPWVWNDPGERDYFDGILRDVADDPDLAGAVVFDQAGPTVAEWLRKVGWIVSTSDDESFHVTVVEGMSSGAVPLVRTWRGATDIYRGTWLHDDVASMAAMVRETLAAGTYRELVHQARSEAARFDVPEVAAAIAAVLAEAGEG
jgi:glycosyltransferase involved in cell wall biosynthesis